MSAPETREKRSREASAGQFEPKSTRFTLSISHCAIRKAWLPNSAAYSA